ncbi:universal stress protein [Kibdelosporangium philippinense]|uniref:Universal stress protein n=1 Tax=Kibdelosporangium philippinense TaxID=211113 RepID=A0ABS8ZB80_9PSEU|nr:universal stress protein [Kibdelosporangium philippinense]MCE7004657.1 universal stress protein [Kibdelosporangium philippinense]
MNKPIVVGVDGSRSAVRAALWAAQEAVDRGLPLRLVHACTILAVYPPVLSSAPVSGELEREGQDWLAEALQAVRDAEPGVDVSTHLCRDSAVALLIEESKNAELIVLGSRGLGGFTGLVVGSVAVALAAHGHCPIVVVRAEQDKQSGPVVVGVDGSPSSEAAVGFAFAEASRLDVPLVAVHAWNDMSLYIKFSLPPYRVQWLRVEEEQKRLLDERLAVWRDKCPDVAVEAVVTPDRPAASLLDAARTAQLVVVGTRGRGGVTGMLLGSTSQALLHHAPCAVAVVGPDC